MRFSKYNHEGYHDLTVYEAFTGIEKERKQEKQAVKQLRASYAVYRPIVYICSPYAGDVKQNVRRAQAYCRFAVQKNCVPIATHLLFPQFMVFAASMTDESLSCFRNGCLFWNLTVGNFLGVFTLS